MGKASKTKKHRNKIAAASAPVVTYQGKEVDTKSLHSDLESIYENKRRDGCELLIGIINNCSADVVAHLATSQLLNILSLRLLDNSAVVKGYTAQIISSMAACKNVSVANAIVKSGCYHAMLTLFAEQIRGIYLTDTPDTSFLEALLEAISNIGAASEAAIAMAAQEQFLTLLIEQLQLRLQSGPLSLCNSMALLLYTFTDAPIASTTAITTPIYALATTISSIPITPAAISIYLYVIGTCINLFNGSANTSIAAATISTLIQPLHSYMETSKEFWSVLPSLFSAHSTGENSPEIPSEVSTMSNIIELYLEITSNLFVAIKQNERGESNTAEDSSDDDEECASNSQLLSPLRAALPSTTDIYSFPQLLSPALSAMAEHTSGNKERAEFSSAGSLVATLTEHVAIALTNSFYVKKELTDEVAINLLASLLATYRQLHTLFLTYDTVPLRSATIAITRAVAALHRLAIWNSSCSTSMDVCNERIAAIVMAISSFPWVEVPQAFCDVLSVLASSNTVTITQAQEVSLAILLRLSNPSCLTLSPSCQYEGSLLLMECLCSAVIDLHSSDDHELYQIYQQLQMGQHLSTALTNINSKIKKEGKLLSRRDLLRCKETSENLEMFIDYKKAAK